MNRVPDNLKTGSNWYGKTTYADTFLKPNHKLLLYHLKPNKKLIKFQNIDECKHVILLINIETMYGRSFVKPQSEICPAKVIM